MIKEIKERLPEAIVLKNDPTYIQGIPDLIVLYKDRWAALEVKKDTKSRKRPNQEYYINLMKEMGCYAAFICPENKMEVLYDLEQSLRRY